jgi:hypothetical protein
MLDVYKRGNLYIYCFKILNRDVLSHSFVVLEHWSVIAPDVFLDSITSGIKLSST